jgi:hypothetical protein
VAVPKVARCAIVVRSIAVTKTMSTRTCGIVGTSRK